MKYLTRCGRRISRLLFDVGRESYCFPDLAISHQDGRRAHVELFHKWHAGQLLGRLAALDRHGDVPLVVGVAKTLAKAKGVDQALTTSRHFAKWGFLFSDFPTPKALVPVLQNNLW